MRVALAHLDHSNVCSNRSMLSLRELTSTLAIGSRACETREIQAAMIVLIHLRYAFSSTMYIFVDDGFLLGRGQFKVCFSVRLKY